MAKESDLTKEILNYLTSRKHFAFKHWGGMMGRRGVSDIIGTKYPGGLSFYLEVKLPGYDSKEVSQRLREQQEFLFEAEGAGAITGIVCGIKDVEKLGL